MPRKIADGIKRKSAGPIRSANEKPEVGPDQSEGRAAHSNNFYASSEAPAETPLVTAPENGFGSAHEEPAQAGVVHIAYDSPAPRRRGFWWGAALGFVALAAGAVAISTSFARVTVTVTPRVESHAFQDMAVKLDASASSVRVPERVVPAEFLEFSKTVSQEFVSTGRSEIRERSRGTVRIFNEFSSSPQTLVAGTRLLTDSGTLFRITRAVTVPGARIESGKIVPQYIEAEALADSPGPSGNLAAGAKFKIPGLQGTPRYDGFYAVAHAGFENGFLGEAQVVSADDIKKAEEAVTKRVFEDIKREMSEKLPPGFTLEDGLSEITVVSLDSPKAGDRRDAFRAEARAQGRVFVFRERDMALLVSGALFGGDAERVPVENSGAFRYRAKNLDFNKKTAAISVEGAIRTSRSFSAEDVARAVTGKPEGDIAEFLRGRSEFAAFHLSFFPPWRFTAPDDPTKVEVRTEGEAR